jgi:hypothetical protein
MFNINLFTQSIKWLNYLFEWQRATVVSCSPRTPRP